MWAPRRVLRQCSRRAVGAAAIATALAIASPAAAQSAAPAFDAGEPSSDPARLVPLTIDVEGSVRVSSAAGTSSCTGPCTLQVAPGFVQVRAADLSQETYVEGPSRVTATKGVPSLRTAGLVALVAGGLIVAAAVAIPIAVCRSERRVDSFGRVRDTNNACNDASDALKVGWIAGAGIGLTAAIVGGIVFGTTGPKLRVIGPAASNEPGRVPSSPSVALVPWLQLPQQATRSEGARDGVTGGAALTGRF